MILVRMAAIPYLALLLPRGAVAEAKEKHLPQQVLVGVAAAQEVLLPAEVVEGLLGLGIPQVFHHLKEIMAERLETHQIIALAEAVAQMIQVAQAAQVS